MERTIDKRNLISSFFITLLIGIAFQEMINSVKDSIIEDGMTVRNSFLALIFFSVSIRYFIGNQLHLFSDSLLKLPGLLWLYDLIVIIIQSILLIFLGSLCTINQNLNSTLGFVEFLVILLTIDIFWIISQWFLGYIDMKWERKSIPWVWAILNIALLLFIGIIYSVFDIYSDTGLILMLAGNWIAFIIDVILNDYYDVI